MKKAKIVIASVLKPVDDTRLFEKFGISLSQTNKYDVNIIGFCSKKTIFHPKITFHPIFNFKRNSIKRLFASWKYYKILLKVKPDIIIISSTELLIVTVSYRIFFGAKLSYDVQENYFNNIFYSDTYPRIIRGFLAYGVRAIERFLYPFVDLYLLAEKCYQWEIPFIKERFVIIENKFKPLMPIREANSRSKLPKLEFLYTGTISLNYGILETIKFAKHISKIYPTISLRIIGHSPNEDLHRQLASISNSDPVILYEGDIYPIPHSEIINAISKADFAILPYQPDRSTENCFPTKIWEYMAHKLPMIIQNHEPWVSYCHKYQSCIAIDFKNYSPNEILKTLLETKFYGESINEDILWESEELTFIQAINNLWDYNQLTIN